jgi:predicted flavoprotein YhiN
VLDVDGDCGGYNLQFAFASGILAGRDAASHVLKRRIS